MIDRTVYGSEPVARVLAYEPLHRVVFSSDIGIDWRGRGGSGASEVEVRFVEESPERTRVELEHRRLERRGDGCERMATRSESEDGWPRRLRAFAERIERTGPDGRTERTLAGEARRALRRPPADTPRGSEATSNILPGNGHP